MPLILGTNSIKDTGFDVDNSCRFNSGDSPVISRTLSDSEGKKFSFSVWLKRSKISYANCGIFGAYSSGSDYDAIYFDANDNLDWFFYGGSGTMGQLKTNRKFRDIGAWYHILCVYDSANGTAGNRMRMYINGVEETSFATDTNPGENTENNFNNNLLHVIGEFGNTGDNVHFGGYMSEVVFLDDVAASPTDFGEFDSDSGIWKPINVSGLSFGTNGFYLDFKASGNLGNDANGGTDWDETNLAATDQSIDTCTNNFATLNPLAGRNNPNAYYATFSEGNLKLVGNDATNNGNAFSTMAFNTGKWYCEVKMVDADNSLFPCVGVIPEDLVASANSPSNAGQIGQVNADTVAYAPDGEKVIGGTESSYGDTFTNNDIIGIAIDCDNGAVYFSKNGTFQASGDPTSGASKTNAAMTFTPGKYYFFGGSAYKSTNTIEFNFGSPSFAISSGNADGEGFGNFEYAVPSGYLALCTKNLGSSGG